MCVVPCAALRLQCMYVLFIVRPPRSPRPSGVGLVVVVDPKAVEPDVVYLLDADSGHPVRVQEGRSAGGGGEALLSQGVQLAREYGASEKITRSVFLGFVIMVLALPEYTNEKLLRLSVLLAAGTVSGAVLQILVVTGVCCGECR